VDLSPIGALLLLEIEWRTRTRSDGASTSELKGFKFDDIKKSIAIRLEFISFGRFSYPTTSFFLVVTKIFNTTPAITQSIPRKVNPS
jgi:hypothetical protein